MSNLGWGSRFWPPLSFTLCGNRPATHQGLPNGHVALLHCATIAPLTDDESAAISQIETEYNAKTKEFVKESIGDYWESLCICIYYAANPSEPNASFEGSIKLPDSSKEAVWAVLQHWFRAIPRSAVKSAAQNDWSTWTITKLHESTSFKNCLIHDYGKLVILLTF